MKNSCGRVKGSTRVRDGDQARFKTNDASNLVHPPTPEPIRFSPTSSISSNDPLQAPEDAVVDSLLLRIDHQRSALQFADLEELNFGLTGESLRRLMIFDGVVASTW